MARPAAQADAAGASHLVGAGDAAAEAHGPEGHGFGRRRRRRAAVRAVAGHAAGLEGGGEGGEGPRGHHERERAPRRPLPRPRRVLRCRRRAEPNERPDHSARGLVASAASAASGAFAAGRCRTSGGPGVDPKGGVEVLEGPAEWPTGAPRRLGAVRGHLEDPHGERAPQPRRQGHGPEAAAAATAVAPGGRVGGRGVGGPRKRARLRREFAQRHLRGGD